jgi:CDP-glucose 4,6-dehydratase
MTSAAKKVLAGPAMNPTGAHPRLRRRLDETSPSPCTEQGSLVEGGLIPGTDSGGKQRQESDLASPSLSTELQPLVGRRVLVTGHTGFKGGWLCLWLRRLGAEVVGISLPPRSQASFFQAISLGDLIDHRVADIRVMSSLTQALAGFDPELIVHMAAQALVLESYASPIETFETNIVGTAVVLEAARAMPSLQAAILVTSDKCYENKELARGYHEEDPLGGADPYSSSKACAEIVVNAYRRSFFSNPAGPHLATARAGNVFGGGDWADNRLVPDLVTSALRGDVAVIRNPRSVRPWQHVLDALSGYLLLASRLLAEGRPMAGAWNFGPDQGGVMTAEGLARGVQQAWGRDKLTLEVAAHGDGARETGILMLDSTKARSLLGWRPRLPLDDAIKMTVDWYRAYSDGDQDLRKLSEKQIDRYLDTEVC